MPTTADGRPDVLFHPFHLCAPRTLELLLQRFHRIHFRDYMALRLTPLMGTTAYNDRMGDGHPDLVTTGRIVQGHPVSGALESGAVTWIDRTLVDRTWRRRWHQALTEDRRFQRGLFDLTHAMRIGQQTVPGPAALLRLLDQGFVEASYTVETVRRQSRPVRSLEAGYAFEYGLALLKTAAAEFHTVRLATAHGLVAVTDSASHHDLLALTLEREGSPITQELILG